MGISRRDRFAPMEFEMGSSVPTFAHYPATSASLGMSLDTSHNTDATTNSPLLNEKLVPEPKGNNVLYLL